MNKTKFIFLLLIFVIISFVIGCSGINSVKENNFTALQTKIQQQFNDPRFQDAHWGVLIKSLESGKIWYEQNSDKLFMPASNEKILTASAALCSLGPDFDFETYLTYNGDIKDSVLNGDIIVFGNGDPTLYNRFYSDPCEVFKEWADTLMSKGIKVINGDIIGDDNAFDNDPLGYGWSFDGLDVWYSAEVGALQLNENYVDLEIIPPQSKEDTLKIIPNLQSSYYKIFNETIVVDTGKNDINIQRPYGSNDIYIEGFVVRGSHQFEYSPSIHNPTMFYVTVLKEVFEKHGIIVKGSPVDCDDIPSWNHTPEDFNLILLHKSPPLKDILTGMMKRSQNLYAETFARLLGWKEFGLGSFRNGRKVVEQVLADQFGISPKTYAYMDGSGLSRYDYVSPDEIVKILEGMTHNEYWDVWYNSLPVAGVDGTLKEG